MNSKRISATVENEEQLRAVIKCGAVELCFIDSGLFSVEKFSDYIREAHWHGMELGLRLPQLWRDKAEEFFTEHADEIRAAGFDCYLFRNMEGLLCFRELGLIGGQKAGAAPSGKPNAASDAFADGKSTEICIDSEKYTQSGSAQLKTENTRYELDHTIYIFNKASYQELLDMLKAADCLEGFSGITLPLELNMHELKKLTVDLRNAEAPYCMNAPKQESQEGSLIEDKTSGSAYPQADKVRTKSCRHYTDIELTVYGRAPMMASAQCVKKTVSGCDKMPETLYLKDRKGALMLSKNICRFCYGVIYNSVPTALFDLRDGIRDIDPDSIRYEFTVESGEEVLKVLGSECPKNGTFTRGHFKKSVE